MAAALVETNMTSMGKSAQFSAILAMWGLSGQTIGVDFAAGARYDTTRINQDVYFGWQVPNTASIKGYLNIGYGNYQWSDPPTSIASRQLNAITALRYDCNHQKVGGAATILTEAWLTTSAWPTGNLDPDRIAEIAFLPDPDSEAISYMEASTPVGVFTDPDGFRWRVGRDATAGSGVIPYTMARPETGTRQGTHDLNELFKWLKAQGVLTGLERLNGFALGVEPRRLAGAAKLSLTNVVYR